MDSATLNVAIVGPISVTWPRTMTPLGISSWFQWVFRTVTGELILRMLWFPGRISTKIVPSPVDCLMIPMGMIVGLVMVLLLLWLVLVERAGFWGAADGSRNVRFPQMKGGGVLFTAAWPLKDAAALPARSRMRGAAASEGAA